MVFIQGFFYEVGVLLFVVMCVSVFVCVHACVCDLLLALCREGGHTVHTCIIFSAGMHVSFSCKYRIS